MDRVTASLTKNRRTTLERIEKFISKDYFTDVNLYGKLYEERLPIQNILYWKVPDDSESGNGSFSSNGNGEEEGPSWNVPLPPKDKFTPYSGQPFGPTWSTHWFIVTLDIPKEWREKEVHLLWDTGSEAMVWKMDGTKKDPLQGLSGGIDFQMRDSFILTRSFTGKIETTELWIEVACNDLFGAGAGGMINPPDPNKVFNLKRAEIAVFNRKTFDLFTDFEILYGMAKNLPENDPKRDMAMYVANHAINLLSAADKPDYDSVREIISSFLSKKNGENQHQIFAFGHCHIDSAWLWPYDETIRKCGRSWASQLQLMDEYPDYRFVASSAQQFLWVKTYYPSLYERIKAAVAKGQFIIVGGTWVEMDGNLPSGESFVRQFLYGQKFFEAEFGKRCDVFWLPDTFGYSPQLPQIMKQSGINYFVTQKLSWSLVNKFPHHNFIWRGIDGSEVLVHFPPGDSYGMSLTVEDAVKTVENLKDKARVSQSMLLYGYGDGGGGPTAQMIERGRRMKNVDGIPKVKLDSTPTEFFHKLEKERRNLNTWSGELYLELHNGTYTTQAELKRKNRAIQNLFRDVEFLDSVRFAMFGTEAPDRTSHWHDFLLQQFHDVLPGSSIEMVNEDANRIMDGLIDALNEAGLENLEALFPNSTTEPLFNSTGATLKYKKSDENRLEGTLFCLPPYSISGDVSALATEKYELKIYEDEKVTVLDNGLIRATFNNHTAEMTSLMLRPDEGHSIHARETILPGGSGNRLVLHDDVPLYWDAWDVMDYHLEAKSSAKKNMVRKRLVDGVAFEFDLSENCHVSQQITLVPNSPLVLVDCRVNWTEKHKFLKMEMDVNVTSENKKATFEVQHGHIERPSHRNTSWDWAKFEVCCQRFADLSEHGFGVAVINLSSHGFAVRDKMMSLSLLRSPKKPDPNADMGVHMLRYAFMPHWSSFQEAGVIEQAMALNDSWNPEICRREAEAAELAAATLETGDTHKDSDSPRMLRGLVKFLEVSHRAVILDAVKIAENRNLSAIVIRLFESHGGQALGRITTMLPVKHFQECNVLENPIGEKISFDGYIPFQFRAFEIKSFLLYVSPQWSA